MTGVGRRSSRSSRKQGATSSSGLFFDSVYLLSSVHLARLAASRHQVCFFFRASSIFSPPGTPCGVSSPGLFSSSVQKLWRESPILRGGIEHHASKRFLTARETSVAPSRRILKGRRSCRARQAYSPQKKGRRLLNQVAVFYRKPFFPKEKWSQTKVGGRRLLKFLSGDGACRNKTGRRP